MVFRLCDGIFNAKEQLFSTDLIYFMAKFFLQHNALIDISTQRKVKLERIHHNFLAGGADRVTM